MQMEYGIKVQLLEIYNEQLRDLLDTSRTQKRLEIRSTEPSGLNVPEAIQVHIFHPAEACWPCAACAVQTKFRLQMRCPIILSCNVQESVSCWHLAIPHE